MQMIQDLRYGARVLLKKPGFTLIAAITLALGIGANTALFSIVNSVLWSPLPFEQPDQLVMVWSRNLPRGHERFGVSTPDFKDWQEQNRVLDHLSAYNSRNGNLTAADFAERVRYTAVSGEFFQLLGRRPLAGHVFGVEEDQPGRDGVVILSHKFWRRHFGGDLKAVGQQVVLDGRPHRILGVMPEDFSYPEVETDLWRPLVLANDPSDRGGRWLTVAARLKQGVGRAQAQTEMNAIAARLSQSYAGTNANWEVFLEPLRDAVVGDVRQTFFILWGAVAFVLLIGCANVANLLLARTAERGRETAIRAALGAGRLRIVRQLLTENLLLALCGSALGFLLALWGVDLLSKLGADVLPRAQEVRISRMALGFTLALSLLTTLLFGLLPAWESARADLHESLKEGGKGMTAGRQRARNLLVVGEVALAMTVLIGAGLLVRSFIHLMNVDPGFKAENVLTLRVAPAWKTTAEGKDEETFFRELTSERRTTNDFYQQLREKIGALPGVKTVAAVNRLPLTGNWWQTGIAVEGRPPAAPGETLPGNARVVTPDYFQTMGVPLLAGRDLNQADHAGAPRAVIINQATVRRYFSGENPLGKRVTFERPDAPHTAWFSIVGVVGDERHNRLETEPSPIFYLPFAQARFGHFGDWAMSLVIRTENDPLALAGAVRGAVQSLDKNLPVAQVRAMEDVVSQAVAARQFNVSLLGFFGLVTLLLSAIGIYGVISYSVSQRSREMGIRMALGATQANIFKLIIGQGLKLAVAGIACGLAGALALTRWMASLLYQVSATDPAVFAGIAILLGLVAILACWIPARRATKADPMITLK